MHRLSAAPEHPRVASQPHAYPRRYGQDERSLVLVALALQRHHTPLGPLAVYGPHAHSRPCHVRLTEHTLMRWRDIVSGATPRKSPRILQRCSICPCSGPPIVMTGSTSDLLMSQDNSGNEVPHASTAISHAYCWTYLATLWTSVLYLRFAPKAHFRIRYLKLIWG